MTLAAQSQLEFGLFTHVEKSSGSPALHELYQEHLSFIEEAEQAGFWGFHLAEHHATPLSMTPSPNLFLAAVSQRTRRMRIGAMVYLLPFYNPLRLIYEISMLDNLTAGRLEMGIGRGVSPFEHAYYGIPTLESREIFDEALAVILKGLGADRLTHHGKHYNYSGVPIDLQPLQKPHPGLWYGCTTVETAIYAARHGMNLGTSGGVERIRPIIAAYNEAWQKYASGPDHPDPQITHPKISSIRFIYVAADDREAEETARAAHKIHFNNIQKLWLDFFTYDIRHFHTFESLRESKTIIAGSPARVHDELAGLLEQVPMNYIMANMKFGNLQAAQSRRSLELFASKVMPGVTRHANAR